MSNELKLTAELVPKTSWYNNMRKVMSQSAWNKLRKATYAEYGGRCGVCEAEGRLNCHELWEYNDESHVQRLTGFVALCGLCHFVKHLGFAGILASEGKLNYDEVVAHFMRVNNCDRKAFDLHSRRVFDQWQERSRHEWTIDLGEFEQFVNQV